jgi:acylphosphatase
MTLIRKRFLVMGAVQGVGFRHSAVRMALKFGVTGWVRNLPDGAVEVHAQGEKEAMDKMEQWLRKGPPTALVKRLTVLETPSKDDESSFVIRHH